MFEKGYDPRVYPVVKALVSKAGHTKGKILE
jgi:hypothetical protein